MKALAFVALLAASNLPIRFVGGEPGKMLRDQFVSQSVKAIGEC